ncbi:hypothetical protein CYMTET_43259 [Cymbomonas tetramitiformis]|uniref:Uncharacterized protein n=1 Tax=Cymbomonas tetramitiformis TaxID=36881 RepID=A0AAE0F0T7_9CHLO|nr:hypothetical protein CYMTET_43259 [Cymbomonas tetramitiformis]
MTPVVLASQVAARRVVSDRIQVQSRDSIIELQATNIELTKKLASSERTTDQMIARNKHLQKESETLADTLETYRISIEQLGEEVAARDRALLRASTTVEEAERNILTQANHKKEIAELKQRNVRLEAEVTEKEISVERHLHSQKQLELHIKELGLRLEEHVLAAAQKEKEVKEKEIHEKNCNQRRLEEVTSLHQHHVAELTLAKEESQKSTGQQLKVLEERLSTLELKETELKAKLALEEEASRRWKEQAQLTDASCKELEAKLAVEQTLHEEGLMKARAALEGEKHLLASALESDLRKENADLVLSTSKERRLLEAQIRELQQQQLAHVALEGELREELGAARANCMAVQANAMAAEERAGDFEAQLEATQSANVAARDELAVRMRQAEEELRAQKRQAEEELQAQKRQAEEELQAQKRQAEEELRELAQAVLSLMGEGMSSASDGSKGSVVDTSALKSNVERVLLVFKQNADERAEGLGNKVLKQNRALAEMEAQLGGMAQNLQASDAKLVESAAMVVTLQEQVTEKRQRHDDELKELRAQLSMRNIEVDAAQDRLKLRDREMEDMQAKMAEAEMIEAELDIMRMDSQQFEQAIGQLQTEVQNARAGRRLAEAEVDRIASRHGPMACTVLDNDHLLNLKRDYENARERINHMSEKITRLQEHVDDLESINRKLKLELSMQTKPLDEDTSSDDEDEKMHAARQSPAKSPRNFPKETNLKTLAQSSFTPRQRLQLRRLRHGGW